MQKKLNYGGEGVRMKEKLTRNLGIKLLSIPLAAIIWVIIINIDDPVSTKVLSNIPVEVLNESYITASGQVYDIVEGNTVSVTIKAKRSIRDKIKASDLKVTADLTEITQFNRVEIVAECTKYTSDSVEVTVKPKMLTVTLEDIATKTLPIQIATTGVVDSGYYVDGVKASPNMIEISGAESTVDKISEVRVSVDVSGHQEDFKETGLSPKVYDEKGREIDSSRLTFSHSDITVKASIIPTKSIPIQVTAQGTPLDGYTVAQVEFGPEQVELAGEPDVLAKIYSIPITIDVTGTSKDMEEDIDLSSYIPENTKLVGDTSTIAVRVTVEKVATKDIKLTKDTLKVENLEDGYKYTITMPYPEVTIYASGNGDVTKLSAEDLNAMIDLSGLTEGTHIVPIECSLSSDYHMSGEATVAVMIEKEEEETPPAPEEDDNNTTEPEEPVQDEE